MLDIYYIKLDELNDYVDLNKYKKYVSKERMEKVNSFFHYNDSLRSLLGEMLARYGICYSLKLSNSSIKISTGEYGKPFFENQKNIHFNIAHSGIYVVCAISDQRVGIDIQKIISVDSNIFRKVFHPVEEYIFKNNYSINYFFSVWALKESYTKFLGMGLNHELNSFYFSIGLNRIKVIKDDEMEELYFVVLPINSKYTLAICSLDNKIDDFHKLTITEITKQLSKY